MAVASPHGRSPVVVVNSYTTENMEVLLQLRGVDEKGSTAEEEDREGADEKLVEFDTG